MGLSTIKLTRVGLMAVTLAAAAIGSFAQNAPGAEATKEEPKPLPPRSSAADYQATGKAGPVTIGAEFAGHFVPTPAGNLTTEDFVIVEVGLYGADGARMNIAASDFSLRVNGKKAVPAQPAAALGSSLKDPEWQPPESPGGDEKKSSKTSINGGGGGGGGNDPPPPPPKMPLPLQRAIAQRTQKAAIAEGDRALPQAGLLFFPYRGDAKGIRQVELIYAGSAGKATIGLHP